MIGQNIQARRIAKGLSQEQLAQEVGVSRQTVAKWESGATLPDLGNAAELARVLDVSLDDLTCYEETKAEIPMPPRGKHIFGTVTLGERGQIVIPKAARELFHLSAGDSLLVLGDEEQGIGIVKADDFLEGVRGLAKMVEDMS